jgi:hypothetical protein
MSALPPKADIAERGRHVRFVPKADIGRCGWVRISTAYSVARTRRVEAHRQRQMTEAKSVSLRARLSRASILRCGCLDRT